MYQDEELDALIVQACRQNRAELSGLGPDFAKIEKGALASYQKIRKRRRTRRIVRIAVATVSAVLLLNVFLFFADFEPVRAYQETIRKLVFNLFSSSTDDKVESQYYKASTEISKVQQMVPYQIPVAGWVPQGYSFDSIQMREDGNGVYSVKIKYVNGNDSLTMNINNGTSISDTVPSNGEGGYEKVTVNGNDLYYIGISVDGRTLSKCTYYDKQGLYIHLSGYIDRQSLLDFVDSMR